jgi:nucleoside 2-deoxyribosyltransferase
LNDEQPAGLIDNQMQAALLSARFVIADLSHANLGAYWEAGFAEGLGRPVIYTCERSAWDQKRTHFDTNHTLTIIWQAADQKCAEDQMVAAIRATLRSEAVQTDD